MTTTPEQHTDPFDNGQHDEFVRTQCGSQGGSGGYQQLRLDDTPGQGRVQANTTQHLSALALGHLKGGVDNLRGAERGRSSMAAQAWPAPRRRPPAAARRGP